LVGARLAGSDFRYAFFEEGNADEAVLSSADFRKASLEGSRFQGADLRKANFRGVQMYKVDLTSADLRGTDFTRADLRKAVLTDVSSCGEETPHIEVAVVVKQDPPPVLEFDLAQR